MVDYIGNSLALDAFNCRTMDFPYSCPPDPHMRLPLSSVDEPSDTQTWNGLWSSGRQRQPGLEPPSPPSE